MAAPVFKRQLVRLVPMQPPTLFSTRCAYISRPLAGTQVYSTLLHRQVEKAINLGCYTDLQASRCSQCRLVNDPSHVKSTIIEIVDCTEVHLSDVIPSPGGNKPNRYLSEEYTAVA